MTAYVLYAAIAHADVRINPDHVWSFRCGEPCHNGSRVHNYRMLRLGRVRSRPL